MRKTEHFHLNQWDLSDRVRMEDFNADNLALEAALAALEEQGSGLGGQLSKKLEHTALALPRAGFVLSGDKSKFTLDTSEMGLDKYDIYAMRLLIMGEGGNYRLAPIAATSSGLKTHCLSTAGTAEDAIAVFPVPCTVTFVFFPMGYLGAPVSTLHLGSQSAGVGSAFISYTQLEGFSISAVSGTTDPNLYITGELRGIK